MGNHLWYKSEPFWYHGSMAMTLRLPAELEDQLKQAAESEHRSVQQTVLLAIEEYLSARETAKVIAEPRRTAASGRGYGVRAGGRRRVWHRGGPRAAG